MPYVAGRKVRQMQVDFGITIGSRPYRLATKTIQLSFAPVVGIVYQDGTWKGDGRKIIEVTIYYPPVVETPSLYVVLELDDSEATDVLSPTYEAHNWKVT